MVADSWLPELGPASDSWDRLTERQPEIFDALAEMQSVFWELVDPVILELCRIRMATILGAERDRELRSGRAPAVALEAKVEELPRYTTSPVFSAAERAAVTLAEQFVLDVKGVTDQQVEAVKEALGAEQCYALVHALQSFEALQRACLVLGVTPVPATINATAQIPENHENPENHDNEV